MKKLLIKNNQSRYQILKLEKQKLILHLIFKNFNFFTLIRWNAFLKLDKLSKVKNNKSALSNRCIYTINSKRFNKFTLFSRHVLLKLIRFGEIHGFKKSIW